jgi:hypothetical protein
MMWCDATCTTWTLYFLSKSWCHNKLAQHHVRQKNRVGEDLMCIMWCTTALAIDSKICTNLSLWSALKQPKIEYVVLFVAVLVSNGARPDIPKTPLYWSKQRWLITINNLVCMSFMLIYHIKTLTITKCNDNQKLKFLTMQACHNQHSQRFLHI